MHVAHRKFRVIFTVGFAKKIIIKNNKRTGTQVHRKKLIENLYNLLAFRVFGLVFLFKNIIV